MEEEIKIKKIEFSNRIFWLFSLFVISFVFFLAGSIFYKFFSKDFFREITVSGEGTVFVKPDVAILILGVKTEGKEVGSIFKDNTEKVNLILKEINKLGIEEKDIQTVKYNLFPYYEWTANGERFLKTYTLDQQIRIKVRDFEKIGNIIKIATEKGANLVNDLYFTIDDFEAVKIRAREEAIKKAKLKAESIARQVGFKLKKIINIYEGPYFYPSEGLRYYSKEGISLSSPQPSNISPEIKAGEMEIKVEVGLVYRIK